MTLFDEEPLLLQIRAQSRRAQDLPKNVATFLSLNFCCCWMTMSQNGSPSKDLLPRPPSSSGNMFRRPLSAYYAATYDHPTATQPMSSSLNQTNKRKVNLPTLLTCLGCCILSFYGGLWVGLHHSLTNSVFAPSHAVNILPTATVVAETQAEGNAVTTAAPVKCDPIIVAATATAETSPPSKEEKEEFIKETTTTDTTSSTSSFVFPPEAMKNLFSGIARVPRTEFAQLYDIGVPLDPTTPNNEEVLLLYNTPESLPNQKRHQRRQENSKGQIVKYDNAKVATSQCHTLKVVLTDPRRKHHCLAIMGQWESYHVHKFMRLPEYNVGQRILGMNASLPLRYVSRTHRDDGKWSYLPTERNMKEFDALLVKYLTNFQLVLKELKPIAERVAKGNDNTIIVMVCNFGQSELLLNFVCSARARGFDLTHVLVFCTDTETKLLAEGLGLTAFYDQRNFAGMPETAANRYADRTFKAIMMAKVYCVHMINALGYDLLFQDVDVVWYRNPMEYFHNKSNEFYKFDMYFQDDGAHTNRYAPWSPNTGFYFIRHNKVTRSFMSTFVRMGDLIVQSGSHQGALTVVLNEFVSWRGLRVKILSRDNDEFPGGFHFHRRRDFMREMIDGKVNPYIFHMSWTDNKQNKKNFFEQMGDFYVKKECVAKKTSEIGDDIEMSCCSAEPLFKCHFSDKPSKLPCKDSPKLDKGRKPFW